MVSPIGGFGRSIPLMQAAGTPPAGGGSTPASPMSIHDGVSFVNDLGWATILNTTGKRTGTTSQDKVTFLSKLGATLHRSLGRVYSLSQLEDKAKKISGMTGDKIKQAAIALDPAFLKESISICLDNIVTGKNSKLGVDNNYYMDALYTMLGSQSRGGAKIPSIIPDVMQALASVRKNAANLNAETDKLAKKYPLKLTASAAGAGAAPSGALAGYPSRAIELAKEIVSMESDQVGVKLTPAQAEERAKALLLSDYKDYAEFPYPLITALEAKVSALKQANSAKDTFKNSFSIGTVDIGETSSPLVRDKIELSLESGDYDLDVELDINRSFKHGQGTDSTNLFGAGPKGKIGEGGLGLSHFSGKRNFLEKSLQLTGGLNEAWWVGSPLQGFFGKAKLPGAMNTQLGLSLFYERKIDLFSFSAGAALGFPAEDINLMNGGIGMVTGKDGKWAKQLDSAVTAKVNFNFPDTSKKSSVAVNGHFVATGKDNETLTDVMVNVSGRFFLSDHWHLGADWKPYNSLSLAPGQTEKSQWALATELGYSVAPFVFKMSANHYSGTVVRSVLENGGGFPGVGTPEQSILVTNLTDVGLGVEWTLDAHNKLALQGFKGWAPDGSGYAVNAMWQLNL